MGKPDVPQPLARVLASDATLREWSARRVREETVLRAVRRVLPRPVADRVFVSDAGGQVLELSVSAGAIAAVVRQKTPDILGLLRREGWQFSGLRVRVQPRNPSPAAPKRDPPQWDMRGRRPVAALAASLPEGPLKDALQRLLRNR